MAVSNRVTQYASARLDQRLWLAGMLWLSAAVFAQSPSQRVIDDADFLIRQRDYTAAAELLAPLARQGDTDASYRLAALYQRGRGVEKSATQAFSLLRTACEGGHPAGCQQLALLYEHGRGTERNIAAAIEALTLAEAADGKSRSKPLARLRQQLQKQPSMHELQSMVAQQQLLALKDALDKFPALANQPLASGHTLLSYALNRQALPVVQLLLHYSDANRATEFGQPPLQAATVTQQRAFVELLVEHGAAINGRDSLGNCALHHAVRLGDSGVIETLLTAQADPNCVNQNGDHPRDWLDIKNQSMARLLTRYGALPSPEATTQETTDQQRKEATLDALQKLDKTQFSDWSRLHVAAWLGSEELVLEIIEAEQSTNHTGTFIDRLDDTGYSALARAAMRGHGKVVEVLLKAGASDEPLTKEQPLAIHAALRSEDPETIALLTEKSLGASWQSIGSLFKHCLDECSDKSFMQLLSHPKMSLSELDPRELGSLLSEVAARRLPLTTALLVDFLSQRLSAAVLIETINSANDLGRSPLWWSLHYGEIELATKIHTIGGQLGARDHKGVSPLQLLARIAKRAHLVRFQPEKESLDQADNIGNTALMEAALEGNVDAIIWLTTLGAKVDSRNDSTLTALMLAANHGHLAAVKALVNNKANFRKRNNEGLTVAEQADKIGYPEIADYLKTL